MTQVTASPQEEPKSTIETKSPVILEQPRLTGNRWIDLQLAFSRISVWRDLQHVGEIPCARNSLLAGIASGLGVGVIRGLNVGIFAASNWAMGTFVLVTLGTWNVCRSSMQREREQIRVAMEKLAQRRVKKPEEASQKPDS